METKNLKVKCYSGYTYAERPESFQWQDVRYDIQKIEKEWFEPGEKHFQVCTCDNKKFQLCYNEKEKQWSLTELMGG